MVESLIEDFFLAIFLLRLTTSVRSLSLWFLVVGLNFTTLTCAVVTPPSEFIAHGQQKGEKSSWVGRKKNHSSFFDYFPFLKVFLCVFFIDVANSPRARSTQHAKSFRDFLCFVVGEKGEREQNRQNAGKARELLCEYKIVNPQTTLCGGRRRSFIIDLITWANCCIDIVCVFVCWRSEKLMWKILFFLQTWTSNSEEKWHRKTRH